MSGLTELSDLVANMQPELSKEEYVFATFPGAQYGDLAYLKPMASICEKEGLSLVIERSRAESAQIPPGTVLRKISLNVHSSLEAVGLTAAVSGILSDNGISANVIAAYFHDHIFIPAQQGESALKLLLALAREYRK